MFKQSDFNNSLKWINRAVNSNPNESAYLRQRARTYLTGSIIPGFTGTITENKQKALGDLEKAESLNNKNLATLRNLVPIYYYLSAEDLLKSEENVEFEDNYLLKTRVFYTNLKITYPNDLGILADLARQEKRLNLEKDFSKTYEMAEKLRPDIVTWHESFR